MILLMQSRKEYAKFDKHRQFLETFFSLLLAFYSPITLAQSKQSSITVTIKLRKSSDTFSVKEAPLKYNKDFAFSFTLDDGLVSAFLVAYPFFTGGRVSGEYTDQWGSDQGADGNVYPGLFYTDGCGNRIPFRAASAINAKNVTGADSALHPGFLSWKQIRHVYHAEWDILSHGYAHVTGKGINPDYQVAENNRMVEDSLQIKMRDFVIPGGKDDYLSDGPYTKAAFSLGMQTVQCEHFPGHLLMLDSTLKLTHLKLGRKFLHSTLSLPSGEAGLAKGRHWPLSEADTTLFKEISSHLNKKDKFWINAFTHSVGNQNLWNISLVFPDFKNFFNQLAKRYGEKGMDNMWMAPTEEVYEYLFTRRAVKYHVEKKRRHIKIRIDTGGIPSGLRYHALTFILRSAGRIKKVRCAGCHIESYSKEKAQSLINLTWQ
jgi:hypothetical protein